MRSFFILFSVLALLFDNVQLSAAEPLKLTRDQR